MSTFNYTILTILGCGLVTWLSRILPFILLKKFNLSETVLEYLSFVPIVIMSALWFSSLFTQPLGHSPTVTWPNLIASGPTLLSAILSKNLLVIVLVGVCSLGVIRLIAGN